MTTEMLRTEGTTTRQSTPRAVGLKREEIELIASQIASAINLRPESNLEEIAKRLGASLHFIPDAQWFSENSERIEVRGLGDFHVFLPQCSRLSSRFALAHELGHYFLHSRMGETQIVANHVGNKPDEGTRSEWEATTFAAALLMPENAFIEAAAILCDFELASRFRVSELAVKKRKEVLGIESRNAHSATANALHER